jgi:long-chain acyl-CoA synthetase
LCHLFDDAIAAYGSRALFGVNVSGRWRWTTYSDFAAAVDRLRGGLASLGVGHADRVAIVSNNRVEWAVAAFACFTLGATLVPLYEAQSPADWEFALRESEAKVAFVANAAVLRRGASTFDAVATLSAIVLLDGGDEAGGPAVAKRTTNYATLVTASPAPRHDPAPDDDAVLMYTSGTTDAPKGVVLTHRNIAWDVSAIRQAFQYDATDRSLAILPWAHVYGQTAELYMLMSCGASMALCQGPDKILADLAEVRPTVLIAVPRVFTRLHAAVTQTIAKMPRAVREVLTATQRIAELERAGRATALHERLLRSVVDRLVLTRLRATLGGRLARVSSGGAALSPEVSLFFDWLGIPVHEGYGLTEASPVVSISIPGARRPGTMGRAVPGVRIAIDPAALEGADGRSLPGEGEIVVYGPTVMKGYYRREEATAATLTADGGLRTGDLGRVDADGYLSITGRIKEQYKLENGKFVSPAGLEEALRRSPYITNAMIYGDSRPFNVALVVPDLAAVGAWAAERRLALPGDPGAKVADARVIALIEEEIARLGESFRSYEAIGAVLLLRDDFALDGKMLTPKLSLKRRCVVEAHAGAIEALYRAKSASGTAARATA